MARNEMKLTNENNWVGVNIQDIKEWAKLPYKPTKEQKAEAKPWQVMKREISLWNKLATQLHKTNPEITENYNTIDYNYKEFIRGIYVSLKNKRYALETIGKIDSLDNGSRGLGRTIQMHLMDINGNLIDVAEVRQNEFI